MHQDEIAHQNDIYQDIHYFDSPFSLQEKVYRYAFLSVFGFGGAAFWAIYFITNSQRNIFHFGANLIIFVALVVSASTPKIPYIGRAGSILVFLILSGISCLIPHQILTATCLFLLSSIILAGILLGKRGIVVLGIIVTAILLTVASLTYLNTLISLQSLVWAEQFSPILVIAVYILIAASSLIPLAYYLNLNLSLMLLGGKLSYENQQLNRQLSDLSGNLNHEFERQQIRQDNLSKFTKQAFVYKPIRELLLDTLSDLNTIYGYTHLEVFVEAGSDVYHHAILNADSISTSEYNFDSVQLNSISEIAWKCINESNTVVNSQAESENLSEMDSPLQITHLWQICAPLCINQRVIGALLIKSINSDEIKIVDRSELEVLSNILALKVVLNQLAGDDSLSLDLSQWSSISIHRLSQASSMEEISSTIDEMLRESPFIALYFRVEKNKLHLITAHEPADTGQSQIEDLSIPIDTDEGIIINSPILLRQLNDHSRIPSDLISTLLKLKAESAAFIPIQPNSQISRLIVLASPVADKLTPQSIQPYALLAGYATTAIEKLITSQHLQRRLIALQSLASISQAISVVTDLNELFDSIHEQVTQVVGDVDLAIALYDSKTDMISIPYAHEAGEKIVLEPFPLGQGLTSILIRTQQPLLLVEETERRARELGAKITGKPAKSWLGVPLIVSGEVLGAILLQDIEHEQRFTEDDLRLITTLASQVAITVRNVRLLQESYLRAERERIVSDITSKIWSSPDVESIARNALHELSQSLHVSEGSIFIQSLDSSDILIRQPSIQEK